MTPSLTHRVGLTQWIATDAHGVTVKRCVASTRALAEAAIGGTGLSVVSAASHAIGIPDRVKAAMAIRLCALCVKPLDAKASPFAKYHPACFQRHRLAYDATRQKVKYAKQQADVIAPAHLSEMRARLESLLAPGQKLGAKRGPRKKRPTAREDSVAAETMGGE